MIRISRWLILAAMISIYGCSSPPPEAAPLAPRAAENVPPEILDQALKSLHSNDTKLQLAGLKFLESFPEIKQQQAARVEELSKNAKDANVRKQAEKLMK